MSIFNRPNDILESVNGMLGAGVEFINTQNLRKIRQLQEQQVRNQYLGNLQANNTAKSQEPLTKEEEKELEAIQRAFEAEEEAEADAALTDKDIWDYEVHTEALRQIEAEKAKRRKWMRPTIIIIVILAILSFAIFIAVGSYAPAK